MKATGIVRRIDDLGRVVIPKEIRRTLHIKESDPLEIFTDRDGAVIFKKYSPMGELGEFAGKICQALNKTTGLCVAICDRDAIVSAAGSGHRTIAEKPISKELETTLNARTLYYAPMDTPGLIPTGSDTDLRVEIAAPILAEGDILGGVLFLGQSAEKAATEVERKLAQAVALFLGKHMEN
ncbi:MAG: AbrB/MazE/SpoVT family DNA-binding domain-containing protein [Oscillospiraceae bacterium]|nr:AbrB/MazE/SpoVT family DNA-binding domain-containing protein [Oscillospiraceae bacterium]